MTQHLIDLIKSLINEKIINWQFLMFLIVVLSGRNDFIRFSDILDYSYNITGPMLRYFE